MLTVGLVVGEWLIEEGQPRGWFESRAIATALAISLAALAAFVMRSLTSRAPVVNLRLFRDTNFAVGVVLNSAMTATLFAAIFLQPLFMEEVLGLTPMRTSIMLLPRSLALMVMIVVAGSLNELVSPRIMILLGAAVTIYAAIDMSHLTSQRGTYELVRSSILQGIGMALAFIPMETVSLSNIPKDRIADATALSSLMGEAGGAIGLAVVGLFFERNQAAANRGRASPASAATSDPSGSRPWSRQSGKIQRR